MYPQILSLAPHSSLLAAAVAVRAVAHWNGQRL